VGATTENPSFRLTGALLSRCRSVIQCRNFVVLTHIDRVFVLERLTDDEMRTVLLNALNRVLKSADNDESLSPSGRAQASSPTSTPEASQSSIISDMEVPCPSVPQLTPKILQSIISLAMGDARTAISLLDFVIKSPLDSKEAVLLGSIRWCASASYDRSGESHYDMISALHKSVRGSQGSAAMYWLARMLTAGEDPLYIARRMVVCASEDIGLADSQALPLVCY
jgi:putative ATPase